MFAKSPGGLFPPKPNADELLTPAPLDRDWETQNPIMKLLGLKLMI